MSKVFGKNNSSAPKPNRNTFDLSFQNNLTLQFGGLYPVMCKEVIPGDSFKIDTTFGLRFMPLKWPVQTRCRADIHFFYVRNRPLWHDFPDWYGKTKDDLPRPYLSMTQEQVSEMFNTGQLGDYMGIPTTLIGNFSSTSFNINIVDYDNNPFTLPNFTVDASTDSVHLSNALSGYQKYAYTVMDAHTLTAGQVRITKRTPLTDIAPGSSLSFRVNTSFGSQSLGGSYSLVLLDSTNKVIKAFPIYLSMDSGSIVGSVFFPPETSRASSFSIAFLVPDNDNHFTGNNWLVDPQEIKTPSGETTSIKDWATNGTNPFTKDNQPILAEPFRAYESIYNSFYRDERNNPYIVNGKIEYNKYIPTDDGGADPNVYKLHFRNWEQDFLTTALPSPQQGIAPLVGISATGTMSFADLDQSDGDIDSAPIYDVKGDWADDGTLKGVSYGSNIPQSVRRSLVNVATSGISINDFRNVNAFQRWLETNIRRGYKFRDVISSHYGVEPSYAELDMPEFLGGVSQDVSFQQVNQMVESTDSPLGSYAGQAYAVGSAKHSINRYFDEPGYVIAILSVVPTPNYSQLLPKMFTKFDSLDIFFPEFGHIGLQPIPYSEVAPVQVVNSSDGTKLSDTFGYQRAWYDYLASVDEVHGEFRTTLRDFLINRVYDVKPELSPDFLLIDPRQVNQVFAVEETTDKILGQVYFDIKAQRPIPKYGVPRLE